MNMAAGGRKRIRHKAGRGRVVSGYILGAEWFESELKAAN
jgi:hypothetical protein